MYLKTIFLFIIASLSLKMSRGQGCPGYGRNVNQPYLLCGNTTMIQSKEDFCKGRQIHIRGCTGASRDGVDRTFYDDDPHWYKFKCYHPGNFGFRVIPDSAKDDYNWQIFDITGFSPASIYRTGVLALPQMTLAGNWSAELGETGATAAGTNIQECRSDSIHAIYPGPFSIMPTLVAGHDYMLLVSGAGVSGGYSITVGGGSADIRDTSLPRIKSCYSSCDGSRLWVTFTKRLRCGSLLASDFNINPPAANVVLAKGADCEHSKELDSVLLLLDHPLPAGNYFVSAQTGTDGNTLLDLCDNEVPVGQGTALTVPLYIPTQMDSLTHPGCAPLQLELVFKNKVSCNSIALDGSDFKITGPVSPPVIRTDEVCFRDVLGAGQTNKILLTLAAPLTKKGFYQLTLVNGTDGNS